MCLSVIHRSEKKNQKLLLQDKESSKKQCSGSSGCILKQGSISMMLKDRRTGRSFSLGVGRGRYSSLNILIHPLGTLNLSVFTFHALYSSQFFHD
ncbi:hypothetical protein XELAEV_18041047mg [Xenopus laevis]|uniref:Uncharacterized protein n=1 Tax=Xenopus laevis TaxID=8355 RepID=A0A974C1F9_XENLA|nr:hypothetical protein XELAEV_18041047mg [Xenopus laevis]